MLLVNQQKRNEFLSRISYPARQAPAQQPQARPAAAPFSFLAAQLPAAVLADLLRLHPDHHQRVRDADSDLFHYAAQLTQTVNRQPWRMPPKTGLPRQSFVQLKHCQLESVK
jgi:hypothetical protein